MLVSSYRCEAGALVHGVVPLLALALQLRLALLVVLARHGGHAVTLKLVNIFANFVNIFLRVAVLTWFVRLMAIIWFFWCW